MARQYCKHPCPTMQQEWLWLDNTVSIPVILSSRCDYGLDNTASIPVILSSRCDYGLDNTASIPVIPSSQSAYGLDNTASIIVMLSSRSGYGQTILQASLSYHLVRVPMVKQYCNHPCHTIQQEWLWLDNTAIIHVILSSQSGYGQTLLQSSLSYYLVGVAMVQTILQASLSYYLVGVAMVQTILQASLSYYLVGGAKVQTILQASLSYYLVRVAMARQYCTHPCHTIQQEWLWLNNTASIPVILSSRCGYGQAILQSSMSYYLVRVAMARQYCKYPCHTIQQEWLWLNNTASIPVILSSQSGYGLQDNLCCQITFLVGVAMD